MDDRDCRCHRRLRESSCVTVTEAELDSPDGGPDIGGMARMGSSWQEASGTANSTPHVAPFGAPYVFVLAVIDGNDAARVHRIGCPETTLGRSEECDFMIDDEKVSRVHCKIRVDGPMCTIVDAESRNGTTVNGSRLAPNVARRLRNLDEVQIGGHRLFLLSGRFRERRREADKSR